jgi:hypothetical protein
MNPSLLHLARTRVWKDMEKTAVVAPGGGDPAAGGAPPMDPSMMGGGAPPMGGGAPPMGGGAPPMDPSMTGGGMPGEAPAPPAAPPMDPSMMGGGMPGAMPGQQLAPQKLKPEQMMQMLDFRLYNMQQQITALMNAQGVTLPPGALVTPPGSPTPVAEAAVPGGPQDPGPAAAPGGGAGGGGGASAIGPIEAIHGASPELAAGGGEKVAGYSPSRLMQELAADDEQTKVAQVGQPFRFFGDNPVSSNVAAVAAMLRRRTAGVQ